MYSDDNVQLKPGKGTIQQGNTLVNTTIRDAREKGEYDKFLGGTGWLAMSKSKLMKIACSDLNGTNIKVFLYMLSLTQPGNLIECKQSNIAKDTGIMKGNVSASIKRLVEHGLILRDQNNPYKYYLNIFHGFNGMHTKRNIDRIASSTQNLEMQQAEYDYAAEKAKNVIELKQRPGRKKYMALKEVS